MPDLRRFFSPRSIALVGASETNLYVNNLQRNLQEGEFPGPLYPINPKYDQVFGLPCYGSLAEVPGPVDLAVIVRQRATVLPTLRECVRAGVSSAIVISSGFGEAGGQGKEWEEEMATLSREYGLSLLGPNCFGYLNVLGRVLPFVNRVPATLRPGNVGVVSQSGGLLISLLASGSERGLGFSYLCSSGNEAALDAADLILFMLESKETQVVLAFIEGLKEPGKFLRVADVALAREKPLVVLKIGRSEKGRRAAASHTGALAGSDAAWDAVFLQKGVTRVENLDSLLETAILFSKGRRPPRPEVGAICLSGGGGALVADLGEAVGLSFPDLSEPTRAALKRALPEYATVGNPLDATGVGAFSEGVFQLALGELLREDSLGVILFGVQLPREDLGSRAVETRISEVDEASRKTDKLLVVFSWTSQGVTAHVRDLICRAEIPFLQEPDRTLKAVKAWTRYCEFLKGRKASSRLGQRPEIPPAARSRALSVLGQGSRILTEDESKELLSHYGIPVAREGLARSAKEAVAIAERIGFPVALKVVSPDIVHKNVVQGVRLNIHTAREVREVYQALAARVLDARPRATLRGVLVQEMVVGGFEALVGVSRDPQLGPLVAFGVGGVMANLIRDFSLRLAPLTAVDAEEMTREIRSGDIWRGAEGHPPLDREAVIDILLRVSALAIDLEDRLAELDINPLVVFSEGQGVKALDATVIVR